MLSPALSSPLLSPYNVHGPSYKIADQYSFFRLLAPFLPCRHSPIFDGIANLPNDLLSFNSGNHQSFGLPSDKEDKNAKTIPELDEIAISKWEVRRTAFLPPSASFPFAQRLQTNASFFQPTSVLCLHRPSFISWSQKEGRSISLQPHPNNPFSIFSSIRD